VKFDRDERHWLWLLHCRLLATLGLAIHRQHFCRPMAGSIGVCSPWRVDSGCDSQNFESPPPRPPVPTKRLPEQPHTQSIWRPRSHTRPCGWPMPHSSLRQSFQCVSCWLLPFRRHCRRQHRQHRQCRQHDFGCGSVAHHHRRSKDAYLVRALADQQPVSGSG
jgi:hypothetical protein